MTPDPLDSWDPWADFAEADAARDAFNDFVRAGMLEVDRSLAAIADREHEHACRVADENAAAECRCQRSRLDLWLNGALIFALVVLAWCGVLRSRMSAGRC